MSEENPYGIDYWIVKDKNPPLVVSVDLSNPDNWSYSSVDVQPHHIVTNPVTGATEHPDVQPPTS